LKAHPAYPGAQGKTIFDPGFDISDGRVSHLKLNLPEKQAETWYNTATTALYEYPITIKKQQGEIKWVS
jgi:hypothetical protein